MKELIILGSGPAGLTAAIYAARANLKPLLIEGTQAGGQLMITTDVENYPAFPNGIQGPQLIAEMRKQAERFGTEFLQGDVTAVDLRTRPFRVVADEEVEYQAKALIIATGASAKLLGLPSEKKLMGHGVSACATCDGYFFKGKEVVVVGGGDTAMEESLFLTKFASQVTIIHRRDKFRASKIMQERARKNEKIVFIMNSVVEEILSGETGTVTGMKIRNVQTQEIQEKKCDGVFIAIGHLPNTQLFAGQLELDDRGYIITQNGTSTSVPGVFAAGDVQDHVYRQAITAAGTGCMAAMDAVRYLESLSES
jgi:thioredoxin reductase (NADPH)